MDAGAVYRAHRRGSAIGTDPGASCALWPGHGQSDKANDAVYVPVFVPGGGIPHLYLRLQSAHLVRGDERDPPCAHSTA